MWMLFFLFPWLGIQEVKEPQKKPLLIRVDPGEASSEEKRDEPVRPDLKQAQEHIKVGDFYFKRDNYKAAAERYREAIRYQPQRAEPYEKLIRALEKLRAFEQAIAVCHQFVASNSSSKESKRFEEWAKKLGKGDQNQ